MAKKAAFKEGGGFLNGVDGKIVDYQFSSTNFDGTPFKPGKDPVTKKDRFHSLYFILSARVDGAEEDVTQHIWAGDADSFDVSEDGHTLTPIEDGYAIGANTDLAKLIRSLEEKGEEIGFEGAQSDDEGVINFEPIVGLRVRFGQEKALDKSGNVIKRKVKKGKHAGKEFDQTVTIIEKVYGMDEVAAPTRKGSAKGKPAPAAPAAVAGKGGAGGKKTAGVDPIRTLAAETVINIISDNITEEDARGTIPKSRLSMGFLTKLGKHPNREPARKLAQSDAFLESLEQIVYDKAEQTIALQLTD